MDKITDKLTVFFENPFWVSIFESVEENNLVVCKVVFGAEPKAEHSNPKRKQREIQKQANQLKVSTKSQLALQKQR